MSSQLDFDHHQPRRIDKKKHHRKGFSEDIQDKRAARVSFKKYVQQVTEEELDDYQDDFVDSEWFDDVE